MSTIQYRTVTTSVTEPISPAVGDMWVNPIASTSYNVFIWINEWIFLVGGGVYIAEPTVDIHYVNVIIGETVPTDIKSLWLWVKESTKQVFINLFGTLLELT